MTPTFARMVAARASAMRKPVRWFSVPQLFRYERQQKGRLKEHFQLNVDLVGEPQATADAELVSVCVEVARELGLTQQDVKVRVSDRGLLTAVLRAIGVEDSQLSLVFGVVDKVEREQRDSLRARLSAGGVAGDVANKLFETLQLCRGAEPEVLLEVEAVSKATADEVRARVAAFRAYLELAKALGVDGWLHFDLSIVRGLAYYTGIVFELFDAQGSHRAICGGGRYDNLLAAMGGVDLPALGFGMGDVVLTEVLREKGLLVVAPTTAEYWVAGENEDLRTGVMKVATALRRSGLSAEYALREQSLARQLKGAASGGVRKVVILKPELWSVGRVIIRDLATGDETTEDTAVWPTAASQDKGSLNR
jgi:histidyl-tRNA synthetase